MALKKGDFVELDYTGKIKDQDIIFDTTLEAVAKEQGMHNPQAIYKPIIVALGEGHILPGLDKSLEGKEPGKYTIEVTPEEGFGKKSAKLLQLIPAHVFKKEKIQPQIGLEVNIDGQNGIIKTVSGGRVIVDFNNPLASKDLVYDVEVKRVVTDKKEQITALLELLRLPIELKSCEGDSCTLLFKTKFPEELSTKIKEDIKRLTGIKTIKEEAPEDKKPVEQAQEPSQS